MAKQNQTDIYYKLGEVHGDVKHILEQTTKTNGRVTKLENEVTNINLKIAYWSGGFAVASYLVKEILNNL